jgi:hypothetical protein
MGRGVDDEVDGAGSGSSSAYELFKLTRENIALRVQVETLRGCLGLFGRRKSNTHSHTVMSVCCLLQDDRGSAAAERPHLTEKSGGRKNAPLTGWSRGAARDAMCGVRCRVGGALGGAG